jgi:hypothetical protein
MIKTKIYILNLSENIFHFDLNKFKLYIFIFNMYR